MSVALDKGGIRMRDQSIQAILEVDRQARLQERQAEEKRRNVEATVAQRRQDLQTAYESGAAEAVAYTKEEQNRRLTAEKARIDARQMELLSAMAARVEEKHDEWVSMLADCVTEQG